MSRSGLGLVLVCGWLVGAHGCRREAVPPSVVGSEADSSPQDTAIPEPLLLVPLTKSRPQPSVRVELPPAPTLEHAEVPARYDDGAYSIAGLRQDLAARLAEGEAGQEVIVRAWLSRIYVPPECPAGTVCPPPKQPHLWLVDGADERGLRWALLVANYQFLIPEWQAKDWKGQPQVVMEVGKRYTVKGRFTQFSDTGFAADQGLLQFVAYRPLDPETGRELSQWVYPPGAAWHPLAIQQQEAANRALAERAAREAARAEPRERSGR